MSYKLLAVAAGALCAAAALTVPSRADPGCGFHCQRHHCPPHFRHCQERGPRIRFHKGCPKPICNPCDLPHWGYWETSWRQWPFPPNWAPCTGTHHPDAVPGHPVAQAPAAPAAPPAGGNGTDAERQPPSQKSGGNGP